MDRWKFAPTFKFSCIADVSCILPYWSNQYGHLLYCTHTDELFSRVITVRWPYPYMVSINHRYSCGAQPYICASFCILIYKKHLDNVFCPCLNDLVLCFHSLISMRIKPSYAVILWWPWCYRPLLSILQLLVSVYSPMPGLQNLLFDLTKGSRIRYKNITWVTNVPLVSHQFYACKAPSTICV